VDFTKADKTKFNIVASGCGTGKAQPLYSKVKTTDGWKEIKDIQLGDTIITPSGKLSNITGIFPQGKQDIYRIYFKDGRYADCTLDHLWKIYHYKWKGTSTGVYRILSLNEFLSIWNKSRDYTIDYKKFYIPLIDWIINDNNKKELPINPYLLGLLIGDGGFRSLTSLTFSTSDSELITNIKNILDGEYEITKINKSKYNYIIKRKSIYGSNGNIYMHTLKQLGLYNKLSNEKFIPKIYKESSNLQKLNLLKGLMDTDGTADKSGSISFSSTSYQLAKDVQELVWSLGGIAKIVPKDKYYTYKGERKLGKKSYTVYIRVPYPSKMFTLNRKKKKVSNYQYTNNLRLEITNIEKINKYEAQCIMIDDNEHLYITDNHIVTHNTYWISNNVTEHLPHIKPSEMLFVTSRSLIVEQQVKEDGIIKFNPNSKYNIRYWNGEEDSLEALVEKGIYIMTYDKIINILKTENAEGFETLSKVKVVFFDECHTIFSDSFIKDMESLKVWIRDTLYTNTKYIIGLTATPRILFFYQKEWGVSVKQLNKEILVNYKAKQLYCTNFNTLHFLLANKDIQGKTIVMCYSIDECYKLKEKIPNSFVLVSKSNNKYYMPEMNEIRDYIVENESLPDTYLEVFERDKKTKEPIKSERKNLEVLITTSTLREGVNLRETSGIKNVAISFTDELHISQWVGRCRYDIENLIVAETYIRSDNYNQQSYLAQSRNNYKEFMNDINHTKWFDSISHLIDHDITKIRRFVLSNKEEIFTTYINTKWLVPSDINDNEIDKYRIYKQKDKEEILNKAIECQLIDLPKSHITFNRVIRFMTNTLGYTIEDGRFSIKRKQYRYKLIVDFDEDYMEEMLRAN
jgi:hypothetical protein